MVSGETVGAAAIAFGASEALGITNVTGLADSGNSQSDPSSGPAVDLSGLRNSIAEIRGGIETAQTFGTPQGRSEVITRTIEKTVGGFEDGIEAGALGGYGDTSFGLEGLLNANGPADAPRSNVPTGTPNNNTPVTEQFANRLSEGSENIGYGIGSIPTGLLKGAFQAGSDAGDDSRIWLQNQTGIEPQGTEVNSDRPGIGITDIVTSISKGTQDGRPESETKTPGEAINDVVTGNTPSFGGITGDSSNVADQYDASDIGIGDSDNSSEADNSGNNAASTGSRSDFGISQIGNAVRDKDKKNLDTGGAVRL